MKTFLTAWLAVSATLIAGRALAQAPPVPRPPPVPMTIEKVKPDLYFIVGGGGNVELLTTSGGALLVDTKNMNDKDYGDLMRLVASVTDQPVKVVVDTHHHADHTGNNEKFIAAGAKVIGQETMPEIFKTYQTRLAPHTPASPNTLYAKTLDVKLGASEVRLYHFGPGHTGADTLVLFPKDGAIAFGDLLVTGSTVPSYDVGNAHGSLLGFDRSLGEALKLKWDIAFPGHGGAPLTRDEVKAYKIKIDQLISRIRDSIAAGVPKDRLIAAIKTDDLGWTLGGQFWTPPDRVDALVEELSRK